jgi:hypothetical protein
LEKDPLAGTSPTAYRYPWMAHNPGHCLPPWRANVSDRDIPGMAQKGWRKSSHSGASGGSSCVEIAFAASAVGVRDSKNTGGPTLAFSPTAWRRFVRR